MTRGRRSPSPPRPCRPPARSKPPSKPTICRRRIPTQHTRASRELKQTSDGITSTVEKTYATKSALEALRNIADNAVETWTGSQKPTASSAPASTWATDQLRKQHAGDVYYDLTSGYSYRWGSTDGKTYAWSLIKDSDITKAIADAAKAQSTANGAQQGVDRLDADIPVTYSTKSRELRQTSESLTAKVTEAQRVGQSALDKASTVEQTADGLKATVSEQARTIEGQTTTIGQLTAKADSLTSSLTQTNRNVNIALANSAELIRNPECNSTLGNPDGWDGGMTLSASGAPEGAPVPTSGKFLRTRHDHQFPCTQTRANLPVQCMDGARFHCEETCSPRLLLP